MKLYKVSYLKQTHREGREMKKAPRRFRLIMMILKKMKPMC